MKKVRVKIEPEEEKPAKGKTSRDHHDGKVGKSLHLQDTRNSCSILISEISEKLFQIKSADQKKSFLISQSKTYVVGTRKNRLNEKVLLSTQNIYLN